MVMIPKPYFSSALICCLLCSIASVSADKKSIPEPTPRRTPKPAPCFDIAKECAEWAKNGFCTKTDYPIERRKFYCAKTCGFCIDGPSASIATKQPTEATIEPTTTEPTTTKPAPIPMTGPCVDEFPACYIRARYGFCTDASYPIETRQKYCAKTCGFCTDGPSTSIATKPPTTMPGPCVDFYDKCESRSDACSYDVYRQNCAKTCGVCTDEPSTSIATEQPTEATPEPITTEATPTPGPCVDLYDKCESRSDYCSQADYQRICAKTCRVCTSPTPRSTPKPAPCFDIANECPEWARKGLCTHTDTKWPQKYCAKTCGFCTSPTPTPAPRCFDAFNNCANWVKNGFCNNPLYPIEVKKRYCAKSCNLC